MWQITPPWLVLSASVSCLNHSQIYWWLFRNKCWMTICNMAFCKSSRVVHSYLALLGIIQNFLKPSPFITPPAFNNAKISANFTVRQGHCVNSFCMGILPDTQNCGLRMRRECRERFRRHRGLAIPTCITARAWHTCRDACRDRWLAVSVEVSGGENVAGIPATHNFAYLVRGLWSEFWQTIAVWTVDWSWLNAGLPLGPRKDIIWG